MMYTKSGFIASERRRWMIIAIIFIVIVFNNMDKQIISVLKPLLKVEFRMNDEGYAVIVNVFTICFALMYPVSGWLVDRFGARLVMFYRVMAWSLACYYFQLAYCFHGTWIGWIYYCYSMQTNI